MACDWLQSVGLDPIHQNSCCHETNVERFLAHFGASPEILCAIFSDQQMMQIEAARIAKLSILHFLLGMRMRMVFDVTSNRGNGEGKRWSGHYFAMDHVLLAG
jgi:hypothetical protein